MAGLYFHIPFCSQRCRYCDFYFVTTRSDHGPFVQALQTEIAHYAQEYAASEPVETIYFGGGTPSLLSLDDLHRILASIHDAFDTGTVCETTLELNPEDADPSYLRGLRDLGIDRLSIGIQSFFQDDLTWMNRSHTADEAAAIVPMVREAGFERFTVDLIFGLPEQPAERWAANLERAAALEVPHLSTYGLTIEEKTVLGKEVRRGLVTPAEDEAMAERYQFTMDYLREHGYEHYEISSFARPDQRALHNQRYWEHANYLGFGPSAHSFWWKSLPSPLAVRWSNVRNLKHYEALLRQHQVPLDHREPLSYDLLADEYIMLRLRTAEGIDLDALDERYGADLLVEKMDALADLEGRGFITLRNSRVRLTDQGKHVSDAVTAQLLLDPL
jgi:oxygen-independent coproporphyrinogen-3 oxidase